MTKGRETVPKNARPAQGSPDGARRPRLRFAPSPNGPLHAGHALSALVTWTFADRLGGEVLLRIEDIDTVRTREAYVRGIMDDLTWLGLAWSGEVVRQSERFALYGEAAGRLEGAGLLYASFQSRGEVRSAVDEATAQASLRAESWPVDPDGQPHYPGGDRQLTPGEIEERLARGDRPAWRIDMGKAIAAARQRGSWPLMIESFDAEGKSWQRPADPAIWGDAIIVRRDTPTSYHLAVVVDDAAQGITHVTRGADLERATDLHRLLQALLGITPPIYHHHGLLRDDSGRKLSKSAGDRSLASLRRAGVTVEEIRALCEAAIGMHLAAGAGDGAVGWPTPESYHEKH
ncbi:MAG: tRNA glutamyl-Q(34) synthetase GluQRS [Rhizobiales bacterium]|nr:tRNA glutamyl-Q(34) synthetase GluQRS [Hyphomicrobiales bacterium]